MLDNKAKGLKMNIAKAIYYSSVSPENISKLILSIAHGFEDTQIRKLNFFDLFIIIPYYSYIPAQKELERIRFNASSSFQTKIERNPDTFSNFNFRYEKSINYIKLGISYCISEGSIELDDEMNINLISSKDKDKIIFNMSKVFSTKETSALYNFFKVDINAI